MLYVDNVSRDTSPIIGQLKDQAAHIYRKYADLNGNNRTCGPGWEVLQYD